jgi:hypothetical protein
MRHPYYGDLVECARLCGTQHRHWGDHDIGWQICDVCETRMLYTCDKCGVIIECCPCLERHAEECPWPL